jgi:DNA replication protein DnaC
MPAANCPECNGTGWKIVEREELSGAAKCNCVDPVRSERIISEAEIPRLYSGASLDNFKLPADNPIAYQQLQDVFMKVRGYAMKFPLTKEPGLLLVGEPGSGKTHLAVAAFRAILGKGFRGRFFDYQNLLDRIKAGYDQVSNLSDKDAYRDAMETDVLLLDDLGSNRVTDWVEDVVTAIITYRANNHLALIATTNLIDGDLGYVTHSKDPVTGKVDYGTTLTDRIGPRARSRLFEMCRIIRMPLIEDFRVRKQRT